MKKAFSFFRRIIVTLYEVMGKGKKDGVAKTPISCVVAHFCSFGLPYVWPQSQKYAPKEVPSSRED
jgi:hypothetical protein